MPASRMKTVHQMTTAQQSPPEPRQYRHVGYPRLQRRPREAGWLGVAMALHSSQQPPLPQTDRAAQRICRAETAAAAAGVAGVAAVAEGAEVVDQPGWAESVDGAGMELLLMLQLLRLLK